MTKVYVFEDLKTIKSFVGDDLNSEYDIFTQFFKI